MSCECEPGYPAISSTTRRSRQQFGIDREAALPSPGAADADPLCARPRADGTVPSQEAALFDADAVHYDAGSRRTTVVMDDSHSI